MLFERLLNAGALHACPFSTVHSKARLFLQKGSSGKCWKDQVGKRLPIFIWNVSLMNTFWVNTKKTMILFESHDLCFTLGPWPIPASRPDGRGSRGFCDLHRLLGQSAFPGGGAFRVATRPVARGHLTGHSRRQDQGLLLRCDRRWWCFGIAVRCIPLGGWRRHAVRGWEPTRGQWGLRETADSDQWWWVHSRWTFVCRINF